MIALKKLLDRYRTHPDFLGSELIDVNQRGAVDDAPLHIASRTDEPALVEALLDLGADVNMPGDLGYRPLHYAALFDRPDIVVLLLSHGANPTLLNEFSQTALQIAELRGHVDVANCLRSNKPDDRRH